jgi:hypothetical protein
MPDSEIKICQNCKRDFTIEPADFAFYEKISVPAPTWCPECRLVRRLLFRNENNLYRKKDAHTGEEVISMYAPEASFKVYEQKFWWSDGWDPLSFGSDYDFSRPFFAQFRELMERVPWPALINWNAVNSEYCNYCTDNKDCYLMFGSDFNENSAYATHSINCRESFDLYYVMNLELSYETVDSSNCYKVFFSHYTRDCRESAFLFDCRNCQYCLGCVGLRNRSYCIFNRQYSKEEYEEFIKKFDLSFFSGLTDFKKKFSEFKLAQPHRFIEARRAVNSSGNNIHNVKNCKRCFDVYDDVEDAKDLYLAVNNVRDVISSNLIGYNTELVYESLIVFSGASRVFLSAIVQASHDIQYSFNIANGSSDLFGCVGLHDKHYCILNRQYSKEDYEVLLPKIIQHMNEVPFIDSHGRIYRYGEFFSPEFSPFSYNETIAQAHFPITKEAALTKGYRWKDPEEKEYAETISWRDLPDNIKDVSDSILNETILCQLWDEDAKKAQEHNCTKVFRVIAQELEFYRKMSIPLPRLCPNSRHFHRIQQRNPLRLWHRKCMCQGEKSEIRSTPARQSLDAGGKSETFSYQNTASHFHGASHCPNEFETSYAPERPEIVYCEKCYQDEVV